MRSADSTAKFKPQNAFRLLAAAACFPSRGPGRQRAERSLSAGVSSIPGSGGEANQADASVKRRTSPCAGGFCCLRRSSSGSLSPRLLSMHRPGEFQSNRRIDGASERHHNRLVHRPGFGKVGVPGPSLEWPAGDRFPRPPAGSAGRPGIAGGRRAAAEPSTLRFQESVQSAGSSAHSAAACRRQCGIQDRQPVRPSNWETR